MCVSTREVAVAVTLNEPVVERSTMKLRGAQEGSEQRAARRKTYFFFWGGKMRHRSGTQVICGVSWIAVLMVRLFL